MLKNIYFTQLLNFLKSFLTTMNKCNNSENILKHFEYLFIQSETIAEKLLVATKRCSLDVRTHYRICDAQKHLLYIVVKFSEKFLDNYE